MDDMQKGEKNCKILKNIIVSAGLFLLWICVFIIFAYGTINWDPEGVVRSTWSPRRLVFIFLCGFFALTGMVVFYQKLICRQTPAFRRGFYVFVIVLAVSIQVFLIFRYQIQMGWDNTDTLVSAISLITGDKTYFSDHYFAIYPNQRCFLLTTTLIVWLAHCFGISFSSMPVVLSLVSMVCMDLSMYVSYLIIRELRGKETAEKSVIWILINPGLYLWCSYYYTTNISLLFITLAVLLFIKAWKAQRKWYYYFLTGMFLLFGIQYRATLVIVVTGAFLIAIIRKPPNVLRGSLLIAAGMLVMQLAFQGLFGFYIPEREEDPAFPVSHWLMMGAQGVGAYNDQDVFYTASFATKEERNEADLKLYCDRLRELGIQGSLELAVRKMTYNWSYGSHAYEPEFQRYDTLYDFLWGTKNKLLLTYEQVYYLTMLLFVLYSIILNWRNYIKTGADRMFLLLVTFLGGILFYLLWETNPYYSVGFMTIVFLCAVDGIEAVTDYPGAVRKRIGDLKGWKVLPGILLEAAFLMGFCYAVLPSDKDYDKRSRIPVVTQSKVCDTLFFNGNDEICQDFIANRSFNTIELWLTKTKRKDDSSGIYQISLYGEKSGLIFEETIHNQDVYRTIDYVKRFEEVTVENEERFSLSIKTIKDDPDNRMGICYYNLPVDAYLNGEISVDGEKTEGDLMINVYMSDEE